MERERERQRGGYIVERLLSVDVALILAGVWLILFGLGEVEAVISIVFGAVITLIGALPFLRSL